jgi:epoxyqueuosine reductase
LTTRSELSELIKRKAIQLGFDGCGFSKAKYLKEDELFLNNWLNNSNHAKMFYMERNKTKRLDPSKLVEGTKSVISVIQNYYPSSILEKTYYKFSKYALGEDYHTIIKDKLYKLLEYIKSLNNETKGRVFVDSAPVLEKTWAAKSGLGWIGKNSLLISKKIGSYIFIGEILINIELDYDKPIKDYCGTCNECLKSCPTQAIHPDRVINSNKCISYLTIENKETIPEIFSDKINNWIFGCDICQDVCPWNNKKQLTNEPAFNPKKNFLKLTKDKLENLNKEEYNKIFNKSAINKIGIIRLKKNIDFIRKKS